ncbi:winged helix-turn-helix transcriptional regulator [Planctomonas sp. JC2975]|nr:helix-turn-helix domain-containing protein [Planctomonas sp. JC2975]NNC10331.1 winged helix-turn-helix transcriptional regulator [Planctomonas sp. JC2975]
MVSGSRAGALSDDEVDRLFHALADATRRDIVARTLRTDQSISALASGYAMSFAAVQKHVAVLESAHLVRKERRGREQLVRAEPETIRRAGEQLRRYEAIWNERAVAIERILAGDLATARAAGVSSTDGATRETDERKDASQ